MKAGNMYPDRYRPAQNARPEFIDEFPLAGYCRDLPQRPPEPKRQSAQRSPRLGRDHPKISKSTAWMFAWLLAGATLSCFPYQTREELPVHVVDYPDAAQVVVTFVAGQWFLRPGIGPNSMRADAEKVLGGSPGGKIRVIGKFSGESGDEYVAQVPGYGFIFTNDWLFQRMVLIERECNGRVLQKEGFFASLVNPHVGGGECFWMGYLFTEKMLSATAGVFSFTASPYSAAQYVHLEFARPVTLALVPVVLLKRGGFVTVPTRAGTPLTLPNYRVLVHW